MPLAVVRLNTKNNLTLNMQTRFLMLILMTLGSLATNLTAQTTKPSGNKPSSNKPSAGKPKMAVIHLQNPSFEDTPHPGDRGGSAPQSWYDCGDPRETPPDVQPGFFGVRKPAQHGATYIGLVVRDNETWEGVGQRLAQPLIAGNCYELYMQLSRAEEYTSGRANNPTEVSFGSAVQVRVWGGNGFCQRSELLYTSPYVTNTEWKNYIFTLKPKKANYNFILIEAYFKTPVMFPYNGNVLLDNISPITQIDCEDKKPDAPVATVKPTTKPNTTKPTTTKPTPTKPTPAPTTTVKAAPIELAQLDAKKLKKGDVIQIKNLYFDADKHDIKPESEYALNDLHRFLSANPNVVIEIGGHTNNRPSDNFANRLSTDRAKAVCDWLMQKGIPENRIQYKGYGKTSPLMPNTTEEGRKKNQRVEIKVLSVTG
jgi:outer membrane protein OmpA-like peptidoglycan-associated protein